MSLLKYFSDAASSGSVATSARMNNVSQPAVSQGIRKLEEQLSVELVRHQKNSFQLTSEGKLLYEYSKEIFQRLVTLEQTVKKSSTEITGDLRIASSQSIAMHIVAGILGKIKATSPKVHPVLRLGKTELIKRWVYEGDAELGVALDKGSSQGLILDVIRTGSFYIVKSKLSKIQPDEVSFIVTEIRNEVDVFLKYYRKQHKKEPLISMTVDSWNVICSFVRAGLGYGLVPDFVLEHYPDLVKHEKVLGFEYKLCVYYKNPNLLSRPAQQFLDIIKKSKST